MSDYQPISEHEILPSHQPRTGLWIGLIGVAFCLIVAIILVGLGGLGWIAYTGLQGDNATATSQALSDSATATTQAQYDRATATARAQIVLPPPGWSRIIVERFSPARSSWMVDFMEIDAGTADLAMEHNRYRWRLEANSDKGLIWYAYPGLGRQLRDFYASVECSLVSGDASVSDCGLAFRILNDDNYYRFVVAEDQLVNITLTRKQEWLELLPWERSPLIRPGKMNQVAVLVEGTHYQFFINGQFVYELDDDQLAGGKAGVLADVWGKNKAEFDFDNFHIYEP